MIFIEHKRVKAYWHKIVNIAAAEIQISMLLMSCFSSETYYHNAVTSWKCMSIKVFHCTGPRMKAWHSG